jgi:prolipoprotein diacylglyceryltransferase
MPPTLADITIRLDPEIHLGPVNIAWHGLTIALGVVAGGLLAMRWARRHGLASEPFYAIGALLAVGGIVGGRLFYIAEHGGALLGTRGFTFDGGMIVATAFIVAYVWRRRRGATAAGAPRRQGPRRRTGDRASGPRGLRRHA